MGRRGVRIVVICIIVVCSGLLAMRLGQLRQSRPVYESDAPTGVPSELFYAGSKNGDVYHNPSCGGALRINTEELVTFTKAEQAKQRGYRPCEICIP
jgi:hypothetical protein